MTPGWVTGAGLHPGRGRGGDGPGGVVEFRAAGVAKQVQPVDGECAPDAGDGPARRRRACGAGARIGDVDAPPVAGHGDHGPHPGPAGHAAWSSSPSTTPRSRSRCPPRRPRPNRRRPPPTAGLPVSRYHPADAADPHGVRRRARHARVPVPLTRLLGVDLGSRRIGLAVADAGIGIARPLQTIGRGATLDADAEALGARLPRADASIELVVGLPDRGTRHGGRDGRRSARVGRRDRRAARAAGHAARRAPQLVRGGAPARADAPRPLRRAAVADPAQRLPRPDRPRGRERDPPGRAGRPPLNAPRPEPPA